MTLILSGHGFRYEAEAVLKLFFPVESFEIISLSPGDAVPETPGDRVLLERKIYSGISELRADCRTGGKSLCRTEKLPLGMPDHEHSCELTLCRLMFLCLKNLTGITPPWGVLTGVRPVKLVSGYLRSGMSDDDIRNKMQDSYYVSPAKTDLCLETAKNQAACLEKLPRKSVSLYVSIPFCPSRCAYCSFVSQTVASSLKLIPEYVDRLIHEIKYTGEALEKSGMMLDTVYFGGGTPTAIPDESLGKIMKAISDSFDLSRLREYTVEAGRPDTIDREKLSVIKSNGAGRISVNPQTLSDGVLEKIGRKHTAEQFFEAYKIARDVGLEAINIDLIAGLTSDTPSGFENTLNRVISLAPENITVHVLSIKRAADMMQSGGSDVTPEDTAKMVEYAGSALMAAGYRPYYLYRQKNQLSNLENVGWEKGGTAGVYNINMMEELQTVLAVGAGGSTKIVAGQHKITRLYNPKYPLEYIKRFDETVLARKAEAFFRIGELSAEL